MKAVFADTVYFLALLNPSDQLHAQARALNLEWPGPLLTTEFILAEVGDALSGVKNRPQFARLLRLLRAQADVEIVPADSQLFQKASDLHTRRPDKEWSLTDCTSFVVMTDRGLVEALSSDHHFEQAGFRTLMRP
jgi:uncharacterized protein